MRVMIQFYKDLFTFCFLLFLVIFVHSSKGVEYNAETYGSKWVYFLDMDGNKRYVDMTVSLADYKPITVDVEMSRESGYNFKVNFWLYTRNNVNDYQVLVASDLTDDLYFVVGKPLVMVTHGWTVNGHSNATQFIKNAYLEQDDVNVVVVDWGDEASVEYLEAARKLPHLAAKVSEMVTALSQRFTFDGSVVHLIGHSLGAHLVSSAGTQLKESGFTPARITGLDPARPFFELPPVLDGISSDSAAFVDIIHTNIYILGIANARGHADFYPNGGFNQKPCCDTKKGSNLMEDFCDHGCSYIYYKESIKYNKFKARKCDDYYEFLVGSCDNNEVGLMGESCDPNARAMDYHEPRYSFSPNILNSTTSCNFKLYAIFLAALFSL